MSPEPILSAIGVHKRYRDTAALDGFDLRVGPGIHGLLGANGAGKSTAVNVFTTLTRPDAGEAWVAGHEVRSDPRGVRRSIGLVGQAHAVDEVLGGRQNLVLFGRLFGLGARAARLRADEQLERFGLTEAATKAVSGYSGGMRRRLDIAVALLLDPAVLFLDEPTTGLDPRARREVWRAVREVAERGTTVLLTTQYLDEADQLAAHVSVMDAGRVIAEGTPTEFKRSIGGDRVVATPLDPARLAAAAAALEESLESEAVVDADAGTVTASAPAGTASLAAALRALDRAAIELADLELRRPTLDDAFIALTSAAAPTPKENS
jgi:ABC-2 type transport system ATP-binding protein